MWPTITFVVENSMGWVLFENKLWKILKTIPNFNITLNLLRSHTIFVIKLNKEIITKFNYTQKLASASECFTKSNCNHIFIGLKIIPSIFELNGRKYIRKATCH